MKNRDELIYQTALLYYQEMQTQTEIAKQLQISRPTVATFLKEARNRKIVQIHIAPQSASLLELSQQLMEKYNLQTAVITPQARTDLQTKLNVGQELAEFIQHRAYSLSSIGIGWGTTLYECVQAALPASYPHLTIVPLMGGANVEALHLHSNHLCFRLAEKFKAKASYYYAPAIADTAYQKQALLQSSFIKEAHKKALSVDLAIVSIGNPVLSSTYKQLGLVTEAEEADILRHQVIGDALATFYDFKGDTVQTDLSNRMVGITLEELEMMKEIVILATGEGKAPSLFALLKKGCVDHIFIDEPVAHFLLSQDY